MDLDTAEAKSFLLELYNMTSGDTSTQASMFDVGAALGLEKAEASAMAEELIVQGLADIVTLSGGIGITAQGLEVLQLEGVSVAGQAVPLSTAPVVDADGRQAIEQMVTAIRTSVSQHGAASFEDLEEVVIDLKTIETQLLSPAAKTAVLREILRSLRSALARMGIKECTAQLDAMIGT